MKKLFLLVMITTLSISCKSQTKFTPEALSYNLVGIDNTKMSFQEILNKHKGKKILIEVWASWCGDCIKNMPKVKEIQNNNPDVVYLFLSVDRKEEAWKNGIEKHELKGEHYFISDGMKGNFGKAINLDWIPRYIIVNPKGEIALFKAIETDFDQVNSTLKQI